MELSNTVHKFERSPGSSWLVDVSRSLANCLGPRTYPLRISIVDVGRSDFTLETTIVRFEETDRHAAPFHTIEILEPRRRMLQARPFVAVQIIPTGVRCEFGGYAGDAGPVTNLLAAAVDLLVTHPNAVNASDINEMAGNVLYVEGKSLDDFLLGHVGLLNVDANKVGTFIDPTGLDLIDQVLNTLNAARAVKGIDCGLYAVLQQELGVRIEWSAAGCAVGTIDRPEAILEGVELLVANGAQAVGGVSVIHGVTAAMFSRHLDGMLPNPSGGVEAIITHLISKAFRLPTAHAPLPYYADLKRKETSNPRAAAEFISTPHYFSVLKGLARAPRLVELAELTQVPMQLLSANNVGAIVVPASCLGGVPALAAEFQGIPLIAVRENTTVLDVTNAKMQMANVIEVESYLEASGVLLALRQGLSLESLRRPLGESLRVSRAGEEVERLAGRLDASIGAVARQRSRGTAR
jgi:hypothetical protein